MGRPKAWKSIAGCQGDTWLLTPKEEYLSFLDFRSLDDDYLKRIRQWGVDRGFFEYDRQFRVYYRDYEYDEERFLMFGSDEESMAKYEYKFRAEEDWSRFEEVTDAIRPTEKVIAMSSRQVNISIADDIAAMLYDEEELGCVGVWWDEIYDPYALSAPRGVIFNSCLPQFDIAVCDDV